MYFIEKNKDSINPVMSVFYYYLHFILFCFDHYMKKMLCLENYASLSGKKHI